MILVKQPPNSLFNGGHFRRTLGSLSDSGLNSVAACLLLASCWCSATYGVDDEARLAELLQKHSYRLAMNGQGLGGPGAEFLIEATKHAQFVAFAEPHNVKEVPEIFAAMFRTLQGKHGYQYVALESGPAILEAASSAPVRGDLEAVINLYKRFPDSFHFYTDQELRAIAAIGGESTAKTAPLWGVDQVHGVPFVAYRLASLAASDDIRRKAQALYEKADAHNRSLPLDGDKFLFVEDGGVPELEAWFGEHRSDEVAFLIQQLRLSRDVYEDFRAPQEEGRGYYSNLKREENMKTLFMKRYREAQAAGDAMPKVLARLGHWHLMRGINPGNCLSFGNFLSEFAKSNGMTSFHIGVSLLNEPGDFWSLSENEDFAPLTDAGSTREWRIIDLRPLRGLAHAGALPGLTASVRDWIFRYDAALLIGGGSRGTYRIDAERRRELRRRQRAGTR